MLGMPNFHRSILRCEGVSINRHGAWVAPFKIECKWNKWRGVTSTKAPSRSHHEACHSPQSCYWYCHFLLVLWGCQMELHINSGLFSFPQSNTSFCTICNGSIIRNTTLPIHFKLNVVTLIYIDYKSNAYSLM